MIDVGFGIGAVSLFKEIVNYIKDRSKKDPELLEMIFKLQSMIMDIVATNAELREKIHKLETTVKLQEELHFDHNTETYWKEKGDGPYCQKCYDKDQNLIRLRDQDALLWVCTTCSSSYFKPGCRDVYEQREKEQKLELQRRNEEIRRNNPFRNRLY